MVAGRTPALAARLALESHTITRPSTSKPLFLQASFTLSPTSLTTSPSSSLKFRPLSTSSCLFTTRATPRNSSTSAQRNTQHHHRPPPSIHHRQPFSSSPRRAVDGRQLRTRRDEEESAQFQEQERRHEDEVAQEKSKQASAPWHRDGSSVAPVAKKRSAGAMTKGKLLTTPSRLLKLIIPLTTRDVNSDRKDVEPLALVVHPHQPLSYLERLIQSELPSIRLSNGEDKIPAVHFRAQDSTQNDTALTNDDGTANVDGGEEGQNRKKSSKSQNASKQSEERSAEEEDGLDETRIDGKLERTGIVNRKSRAEAAELRGGHGEGGVESFSGAGHEGAQPSPSSSSAEAEASRGHFVRWSSSTEVGDFIRDAARGKEFAVEIEGHDGGPIYVGVPSFNDRTHYLRLRLRGASHKIRDMAGIKGECDRLAHRSAQRVAMSGFAGLVAWWFWVYYLTFRTELGWDVMEPVTYLVGLSGIMGGYLWFLYHNREVSYRSALNLTVSRRQQKLYLERGFDVERWESLVQEGNALRGEIKAIAGEYDVEWDERADEQDETVHKALKKARQRNEGGKKKGGDDDDDASGGSSGAGKEDVQAKKSD